MSLALKWENGLIYFDAVTAYQQSFNGSVTKHPIDAGGNITDHFIRENPVFNISAVISSVDISGESYSIRDVEGVRATNASLPVNAVQVRENNVNLFSALMPDSIGQYLPSTDSRTIAMDDEREDKTDGVKSLLIELMRGFVYNETLDAYDPNIQVVSIYEYDGLLLKKQWPNFVVTNISFHEDETTGSGIYVDLTLEQVEFVYLRKTTIPKRVRSKLTKKSKPKTQVGKCSSEVGTASTSTGTGNTTASSSTGTASEKESVASQAVGSTIDTVKGMAQ